MTDEASPLKKKRNFKPLKLASVPSNAGSVEDLSEETRTLNERLAATHESHFSELKPEDFEDLGEIGHGAGGTVKRVKHTPTGDVYAKKDIILDAQQLATLGDIEPVKKQIFRELQFLHTCRSEYITGFFGASVKDGEISIYMEYMDCSSLDNVYKKAGTVEEAVIGKITIAVLEGLVYLYNTHKIIHRDIKPSNILCNSKGEVKLCDFGVSGEAINSVAKTFVGTKSYMAPERIKGTEYSVRSDVWSLGLTLLEVAIGKFPFPPDGKPLTYFELLDYIISEAPPTLPAGQWSPEFEDFISKCLIKDAGGRPTPSQLLQHKFVEKWRDEKVDLAAWTKKGMA